MGEKLDEFYQQFCLKHIGAALQRAVGQPPKVVADEALFKQAVIEPGWNSLPLPIRRAGRKKLRWDEFLLALRKDVYHGAGGKLTLRPDAVGKTVTLIRSMFGGSSGAVPAPQLLEPDAAKPLPVAKAPAVAPNDDIPVVPVVAPPTAVAVPAKTVSEPPKPVIAKAAEIGVGIDLGTTYSAVAYVDGHGRPCTIHNSAGDLTTPSIILLDEGGPVVGKEAMMAASMEPEKIAVCVKRDMGARVYRKKVDNELFPPEVLSSLILKSLREDAERKLGSVKKAVITVPAYFDEARRRATLDAGRLAGLEVLDIINEPTAAAIAYGYQVGFLDSTAKAVGNKPLRVLVYDLGGGTFDVTIVRIEGRSFKALATDGDVSLGGKDWDERLVDIAASRVKTELREDPRDNPNTLQELWQAAEIAKKTLTERNKTTMYINHLGSRHKVEITRQEFEEATASLLGRTRTTTEIVVRQAGLKWPDIDKTLLVGGSTRMPMVVRMLEEISGKPPERSVSPDEAVAHGAALYAELLLQQKNNAPPRAEFSITNVNSHSLGLVGIDKLTGKRRNQILIPKNTPLPHSVSGVFKTHKPNQPNVVIRIVEGESERPEACTQIGVCKVDPLPPNLPAGWPILVKYSYLSDGQLEVSAQVKGQNKASKTVLQRENNMPEDDLNLWQHFVAAKGGG